MQHLPKEITDNFDVIDTINFWFFGVVYKVQRISDNKLFAMKIVVKKADDSKSWKDIENEIRILSVLNNPYLLHLERKVEKNMNVYMIIDYCKQHDLLKHIADKLSSDQVFQENEIWKYFIQICFGLECLHSNGYIHRDIKPENILLDENMNVKTGDFGLSRYLITSSIGGTPHYYSPEIWDGVTPSKESDIWALGCVIYLLCMLKHPFEGNMKKVKEEEQAPIRNYSNDLKNLVDWCLKKEKCERPTINDILTQPFVVRKVTSLRIKIPSQSVLIQYLCGMMESNPLSNLTLKNTDESSKEEEKEDETLLVGIEEVKVNKIPSSTHFNGLYSPLSESDELVYVKDSTTDLITLNLNSKTLSKSSNLSHKIDSYGSAYIPIDQSTFFYGGLDWLSNRITGEAFIVDKNKVIREVADGAPTYCVGLVYHENCIYALGGVDQPVSTKYILSTNRWQSCAPLPEKNFTWSCCSTFYDHILIVVDT
ncbi:unnamed protein product [Blepharisma stoltei]|uniref:non-specific serine/threonine protein kinase n=1 Tax=Blepharisma stoltei TaxID=1481888 RepID=A0AAU9IK23_9CILI|nr:unnamed protein product [Blepharisma stoltei]